jgi:hypothetical protein
MCVPASLRYLHTEVLKKLVALEQLMLWRCLVEVLLLKPHCCPFCLFRRVLQDAEALKKLVELEQLDAVCLQETKLQVR